MDYGKKGKSEKSGKSDKSKKPDKPPRVTSKDPKKRKSQIDAYLDAVAGGKKKK